MSKTIAKSYDKIAIEYTQKYIYGEHLSLSALKKFIFFLPTKAKILDVGCGGGQDLKFLIDKGFSGLGIDVSKKMIELAKKYAPQLNFKVADVVNMPNTKAYDAIWCCRVFNHISINEQDKFLDKLTHLLKKDGILYLTSVTSDTGENYEAFDSGNDCLLKKRLTEETFKDLFGKRNFKILDFKYWVGKKGMEIFAKKI